MQKGIALKIIDADIQSLKELGRRGRERSAQTLELIDAINALEPGGAKAVVLDDEGQANKIRARLGYVSKLIGKPLQVAVDGDHVFFALKEVKRPRGRPRKNRR